MMIFVQSTNEWMSFHDCWKINLTKQSLHKKDIYIYIYIYIK